MTQLTRRLLDLAPPGGVFDLTVMRNLFPTLSPNALRALLYRAIHNKEVIRLKCNLFCLGPPFSLQQVHPFVLANRLCFPSHVSLESALSYHGLIPEAVHEVASVTSKRAQRFTTELGVFSYTRVAIANTMFGVNLETCGSTFTAFVANPFRALADLIYVRKDVAWREYGIDFITQSMRIELSELKQTPVSALKEVISCFHHRRVNTYLRNLYETLRTA